MSEQGQKFFEDFDTDFEKTAAAEKIGRIPEGTYKVVCIMDPRENGSGDCEPFETPKQTKGLKIWFEILAPETVEERGKPVKTKGRIMDHVFWVTKKNLPYVKRDVQTILGRDVRSVSELVDAGWVGKTCEVVVRHEEYNDEIRSRVAFINSWKPQGAAEEQKSDPVSF